MAETEELVGWWDETLDAGHWFALRDVSPLDAALLLCRHNPREVSEQQALSLNTDHASLHDFARLVMRFRDEASALGAHPRSLSGWLDYAVAHNLRIHPWAAEYLAARTAAGPPAPPSAEPRLPLKRVPLMEVNRNRVLVALRDAGFDPLALPRFRGRRCPAKCAARDAAKLPQAAFEHAWKDLMKAGEIRRAS